MSAWNSATPLVKEIVLTGLMVYAMHGDEGEGRALNDYEKSLVKVWLQRVAASENDAAIRMVAQDVFNALDVK